MFTQVNHPISDSQTAKFAITVEEVAIVTYFKWAKAWPSVCFFAHALN